MIEELFFKQKIGVTKKGENRLATSMKEDSNSDIAGESDEDYEE